MKLFKIFLLISSLFPAIIICALISVVGFYEVIDHFKFKDILVTWSFISCMIIYGFFIKDILTK